MTENLLDLTIAQLQKRMHGMGKEKYRASQIYRWIYHQGVLSFDGMTNIARPVRQELQSAFTISPPVIEHTASSGDGTRKFLMRLTDGQAVESVLIPEPRRNTLCISTQVGCRMGCAFCSTGKLGLTRDLSTGEIVGQWLAVMLQLKKAGDKPITNVVLMGMGEPLDNLANSVAACSIMLGPDGPNLSTRRLTLSTVGLADRIADAVVRTGISLAVSLNAPDDKTRSKIMPVNKRYPLDVLFGELERVPLTHRRRITFEYVLIDGINDSPAQARSLARLMKRVPSKVNLIPLNPGPHIDYSPPDELKVREFQSILRERKVTAVVRKSRGGDVTAACGQLVAGLKPYGGN